MRSFFDFSTISYEGFVYRLIDEFPEELLCSIIGNVELYEVPPVNPYRHRETLYISHNRLQLGELTCHLNETDAKQLMRQYSRNGCIEFKKGITGRGENTEVFERCAVTISALSENISFTGRLCARQLYTDEMTDGIGQTHDEVSTFFFQEGILQARDSCIIKDPTTLISKLTWSPEVEKAITFAEDIDQNDDSLSSRTMYYVNPTGNIRQNNAVIASVTWYIRSGRIDHKMLDAMLEDKHPVLRTEIKVNADPSSKVYVNRVYDLVSSAVEGLELGALRKMAPYIEYGKYTDYPEKLLSAVYSKARASHAPMSTALIRDISDALVILQESGLQDVGGSLVKQFAIELLKLVAEDKKVARHHIRLICDVLCKMTSQEKVQNEIIAML